ncbi:MAG: dihydroorotate dehydrogenase (quinone), partial [Pseudomonadota bacterium]|nr:dihydroorotate dehydrogenase (quinone) [Pseudomonadota bacterium]
MIWRAAAGLARLLPPEAAHRAAVETLRRRIGPSPELDDMPVDVAGLSFRNPVGLAAGFDKDAACPDGALRLGFGHVELGTITPLAQPGNPRPRVFRLPQDRAVINRYGFNSSGMEPAAARLAARRSGT